ncbi:MAG: ankyrin repeat domain-containing protein [Phycisphaerales bacterium]
MKHPDAPNVVDSPLAQAAITGDHAALAALVQEGANVNERFTVGQPGEFQYVAPLLCIAAASPHGATADTLRLLIDAGADVESDTGRFSAIEMTCMGLAMNHVGGDLERLVALLSAGATLPSSPEAQAYILCAAARTGDPERLGFLLERGFDPNGHWDQAEAKRSYEELHAMFETTRDTLFPSEAEEAVPGLTNRMKALEADFMKQITSAPSPDEIPLFVAAQSGNAECVRSLLNAGADVSARDNSHQTAIFCARSLGTIRALMAAGLSLEDVNCYGWTPLMSAVGEGEYASEQVRCLIEAGANIHAAYDRGYTVFMRAVGSGRNRKTLTLLRDAGVDVHAVSELGYNAFHAAIDVNGEASAEKSVRDTLNFLKECGVDINHRNNAGYTPLARSLEWGVGIDTRVLCELGADAAIPVTTTVCDAGVCTCVEQYPVFAAFHGYQADQKVAALIEFGTPLDVRDHQDRTPTQAARDFFDDPNDEEGRKILAMLRAAGAP